jgi:hypothetical protein
VQYIQPSLNNVIGDPSMGNDNVSAAEEFQKNLRKPLRKLFYSVGYRNWNNPEEQRPFRHAVKAAKDSITWFDFSKNWSSYDAEYQTLAVDNFKSSLLSNLKYINQFPHV